MEYSIAVAQGMWYMCPLTSTLSAIEASCCRQRFSLWMEYRALFTTPRHWYANASCFSKTYDSRGTHRAGSSDCRPTSMLLDTRADFSGDQLVQAWIWVLVCGWYGRTWYIWQTLFAQTCFVMPFQCLLLWLLKLESKTCSDNTLSIKSSFLTSMQRCRWKLDTRHTLWSSFCVTALAGHSHSAGKSTSHSETKSHDNCTVCSSKLMSEPSYVCGEKCWFYCYNCTAQITARQSLLTYVICNIDGRQSWHVLWIGTYFGVRYLSRLAKACSICYSQSTTDLWCETSRCR